MKKTIAKVIALTAMASVQAAWASEQTVGTTNVVVDVPSRAVIVSCQMRPTDPTIMDVVYRVESAAEKVKVRALAFKDGKRDFAHVLRPETFVDGTATNLGDEVAANVEHTLSWKVTADWNEEIGNVSFEVLTMANTTNSFVLPYMYREEVRTGEREYYLLAPETIVEEMDLLYLSYQPIRETTYYSLVTNDDIRRNILFWFYSGNDSSLILTNGQLYWERENGKGLLLLCDGNNTYRNGDGCGDFRGYGRTWFPSSDIPMYCYRHDDHQHGFSPRLAFNVLMQDKFRKMTNVECIIHPSSFRLEFDY